MASGVDHGPGVADKDGPDEAPAIEPGTARVDQVWRSISGRKPVDPVQEGRRPVAVAPVGRRHVEIRPAGYRAGEAHAGRTRGAPSLAASPRPSAPSCQRATSFHPAAGGGDRPRRRTLIAMMQEQRPRLDERLLPAFLSLTFILTWALWLPLGLIAHGPGGAFVSSPAFFLLQTAGAAVPSLVAIALFRTARGRNRRRDREVRRYLNWRVGIGWYLVAALLVPSIALTAAGLSILSGGHLNSESHLGGILAEIGPVGLALTMPLQLLGSMPSSPLLEEFGWRGLALPLLQDRMNALEAAVTLGVIWGLWHLPLWMAQGEALPHAFALIALHSILMAWIFNSTGGSLILAMLFHASLNVGLNSLAWTDAAGFELLLTLAVVVVVIWTYGTHNLASKPRVGWASASAGN